MDVDNGKKNKEKEGGRSMWMMMTMSTTMVMISILYLQAEPVTLRITGPPRLDLEPGTR